MRWFAAGVVAAAGIAGCAPVLTVQNDSTVPVRVVVSASGNRQVLSPSPGQSSSAEVGEGAYSAYAIPDAEWIEYARLTRRYLNDQLVNADNLTGTQLLEVIRRLKDIAARMQAYEGAAGSTGACNGTVSAEEAGLIRVAVGPDGKLQLTCG
jgi:hypothetical protein